MNAAGLIILILFFIGAGVGLYYAYMCLSSRPKLLHLDPEHGPLMLNDHDVNGNHEEPSAPETDPIPQNGPTINVLAIDTPDRKANLVEEKPEHNSTTIVPLPPRHVQSDNEKPFDKTNCSLLNVEEEVNTNHANTIEETAPAEEKKPLVHHSLPVAPPTLSGAPPTLPSAIQCPTAMYIPDTDEEDGLLQNRPHLKVIQPDGFLSPIGLEAVSCPSLLSSPVDGTPNPTTIDGQSAQPPNIKKCDDKIVKATPDKVVKETSEKVVKETPDKVVKATSNERSESKRIIIPSKLTELPSVTCQVEKSLSRPSTEEPIIITKYVSSESNISPPLIEEPITITKAIPSEPIISLPSTEEPISITKDVSSEPIILPISTEEPITITNDVWSEPIISPPVVSLAYHLSPVEDSISMSSDDDNEHFINTSRIPLSADPYSKVENRENELEDHSSPDIVVKDLEEAKEYTTQNSKLTVKEEVVLTNDLSNCNKVVLLSSNNETEYPKVVELITHAADLDEDESDTSDPEITEYSFSSGPTAPSTCSIVADEVCGMSDIKILRLNSLEEPINVNEPPLENATSLGNISYESSTPLDDLCSDLDNDLNKCSALPEIKKICLNDEKDPQNVNCSHVIPTFEGKASCPTEPCSEVSKDPAPQDISSDTKEQLFMEENFMMENSNSIMTPDTTSSSESSSDEEAERGMSEEIIANPHAITTTTTFTHQTSIKKIERDGSIIISNYEVSNPSVDVESVPSFVVVKTAKENFIAKRKKSKNSLPSDTVFTSSSEEDSESESEDLSDDEGEDHRERSSMPKSKIPRLRQDDRS